MIQTHVLYNVWVPYCVQKTALLLESSHDGHLSRVIGLKEGGMEDLSGTGQVVTCDLVDSSIRTRTQRFIFYEFDSLISKLSLD